MMESCSAAYYRHSIRSKKNKCGNQNLIQKIYNREIQGTFKRGCYGHYDKSKALFRKIPKHLIFSLEQVLPNMIREVCLGLTRCGQFVVTYSMFNEESGHKYMLHWYAFRPGAAARKVAEVQLFGNAPKVKDNFVDIGIAQWPNVSNKLVVYACSNSILCPDLNETNFKHYLITVTTLPSLHNCSSCKSVANSFDEDDMAANWDSCVVLSCLEHGLTIHTHVDIASPYPCMDFRTNLKIDNKIIINTVNFLHVLSFGDDRQEVNATNNDTIVNEELNHKIGEKLALVGYECPRSLKPTISCRRKTLHPKRKAWLKQIMDKAEKAYAFVEKEDGCEKRFKWFQKRRLADKMYEFCSDDDSENAENICPPNRKLRRSIGLPDRRRRISEDVDLTNEDSDVGNSSVVLGVIDKENKWKNNYLERSTDINDDSSRVSDSVNLGTTSLSSKIVHKKCTSDTNDNKTYISNLSNYDTYGSELNAILDDWNEDYDSEPIVFSPIPISKIVGLLPAQCKIHHFSDSREGSDDSNTPSLVMVLRDKNFILKEEKELPSKKARTPVIEKCSIKFDRNYIEVDEEILSSMTDIEDDDLGTGFHCALPLSVHGSAYAQLQLVSSNKAERMNILTQRVNQASLDIEHVCSRVAEIICNIKGLNFKYCYDYDIEIIDVCSLTADILALLSLRMNVELKHKNDFQDARKFYEVRCIFTWNSEKDQCWLEANTELIVVIEGAWMQLGPAHDEAQRLRTVLRESSWLTFDLNQLPYNLNHRLWITPFEQAPSLVEILDHSNLIGLKIEGKREDRSFRSYGIGNRSPVSDTSF